MNDDPSQVDVLFIKANDNSGCLQKISNEIADYFIKEGNFQEIFIHIHKYKK